MLANTRQGYGLVSILSHWLSAIAVIGLFGLGYWMVDLTYYSAWYQKGPHLHKSIGILLLALTLVRLLWKLLSQSPQAIPDKPLLQKAARLTHWGLYLLLLLIMLSGILISTADGRGITVFDWFELPGVGELFNNQADIAGAIHKYAAYSLMALVVLHALAALKHHFIDKDQTLVRMIKLKRG
ncbi:cytochrome b [Shewanella algae]|uniref:cytochrome b n=1 Tax=Shewanella algae TaxID=38313 RepID=UPI0022306E4B|nr:cytochrome b [Shewanella algae]UZD59739.1 cytochrome b [Shewanella algae]